MKKILFLSLVLLTACKSNNQISRSELKSTQKIQEESKSLELLSFKTFSHGKIESKLRMKLLNLITNKKINNQNEYRLSQIEEKEELFSEGKMSLSENELSLYRQNTISKSELIVSYVDHTDIFFIEKDLDINKILETIDVKNIHEKKEYLNEDKITAPGQKLYVVVYSQFNILKNDQEFFKKTGEVINVSNSIHFNLHRSQKIQIAIKNVMYLQGLKSIEENISSCSFERKVPSPEFHHYIDSSNEVIGVRVILNNQTLSIKDFIVHKEKELTVLSLELSKFTDDESVSLEIIKRVEPSLTFESFPNRYTAECANEMPGVQFHERKFSSEVHVATTIYGRGEELLSYL
jgi:hypothetical protein